MRKEKNMFSTLKTIIYKSQNKGRESRNGSKHSYIGDTHENKHTHSCKHSALTLLLNCCRQIKICSWVLTKPQETATTTPYEKLVQHMHWGVLYGFPYSGML